MSTEAEVFLTCHKCGDDILTDEEYWCVTVSREKFDGDAVDVLYARQAPAFCQPCVEGSDLLKEVHQKMSEIELEGAVPPHLH